MPTTPPIHDPPDVLARIRDGLDLVDIISRQMCRRLGSRFRVDEIASYGHEGLLSAARSYQEDRGVPFRRWANLRIRGAILDGVRAQSELPRHVHRRLKAIEAGDTMHEALLEDDAASPVGSAEDADHRLATYLRGIATAMAIGFLADRGSGEVEHVADRTPNPEETVARAQLTEAMTELLAQRPREERRLIQRHYFEGATFEAAARELGLSKSWASRLHARAIDALGKELARRLRDPVEHD